MKNLLFVLLILFFLVLISALIILIISTIRIIKRRKDVIKNPKIIFEIFSEDLTNSIRWELTGDVAVGVIVIYLISLL